MANQIYIGNFSKGLKDYTTAFNIDNDAFPYLFNMYAWRGRLKRKRGTVKIGRLTRQVQMASPVVSTWQYGSLNTNNLITGLSLESTSSIVPGTISIFGSGGQNYTDLNKDGTLQGNVGGTGTINYSTGDYTISGFLPITGTFSYYPSLPVMGERDFVYGSSTTYSNYPLLIAFDTKYAYQCTQLEVNNTFFSVSYYKATGNDVTWSGQDYQLFWSTNYPSSTTNQQGAFWATNNVPGLHGGIATYSSGSGTAIINITGLAYKGLTLITNLIIGDKVWFNDWGTNDVNLKVGTISNIGGSASGNYSVTFSSSVTISGTGFVEVLTNSVVVGGTAIDGIRWYDGDMTSQTGIPTSTTTGWVNFAPPLTATTVSIAGLPAALYYLVGALTILPFKDRLLFFSPYVQTSTGNPIQLQDTVLWSWNGTPFYTVDASGNPILVPNNQTASPTAYYVDQTGLGGYLPAGISQPIQTVTNNEDVLLIGFGGNGRKTRFAYTANDLQPFLFYNINSELPSTSTFSSVVLDKGAIDIGSFGICITDQQSAQRIDLDIPNAVFQIQKDNNGALRVNGIRDYINEWITFSYPVDDSQWRFPTQSFFFNYRENTWAIFYENYTCHGNYRPTNNLTWASLPYQAWTDWTDPWNTGTQTAFEIQVIAGNPQGYVISTGIGTDECISGYISALSDDGNGNTQITSYEHCLESNNPNTFTFDFIFIEGCLGTNASLINGDVYRVIQVIDANNFVVNYAYNGADYMGAGEFRRLSQPVMQTKQFPVYWEQGRQVRIGTQKYLLDTTASGQVTLNIYLSQDPIDPWNNPNFAGTPNGLVYTQLLYTCPESTNIGLTAANTNLQMPVGKNQQQIWHRMNTSLIGDTFQVGITLSNDQMENIQYAKDEIVLHGMQFTTFPGPLLA